jgi:amidase/aspartyl-tRNA(Asn)/glutamyl-tRNA(Gln) amidotransferase subunit A
VKEDIRAAVRKAAYRFEELGAVVEPVEFNFDVSCLEMADLWCRIVTTTALTNLVRLKDMGYDLLRDHRDDLPPEMHYWLDVVSAMTVPDQLRDLRMRTAVYDEVENKMEKYDLILSPTLACHPVKNLTGQTVKGPAAINGVPCNEIIGWCLTIMTSLTGHASASVPVCVTDEGFPIGMHIMGQRYGDVAVLTAAAEFERSSPWKDTYDRIKL